MEDLFPNLDDSLDRDRITVSPSRAGDSSTRPEAVPGGFQPSKTAEVARAFGILSQPRLETAPPAGESLSQRLKLFAQEVRELEANVETSRPQADVRSDVDVIPSASDETQGPAQVRARFTRGLLEDLRSIQAHSGTPLASIPANRMLHDLRDLRDLLPFDPFVEVAMALYDGLVFENRWGELSVEQYQGVYTIFLELPRDRELSEEEVIDAILAIERLGIDTTPFPTVAEELRDEERGDGGG